MLYNGYVTVGRIGTYRRLLLEVLEVTIIYKLITTTATTATKANI